MLLTSSVCDLFPVSRLKRGLFCHLYFLCYGCDLSNLLFQLSIRIGQMDDEWKYRRMKISGQELYKHGLALINVFLLDDEIRKKTMGQKQKKTIES